MKTTIEAASGKQTTGWVWKILRWSPLALLAVSTIFLAVLYFSGGLYKITAWYLADFLPVMGLVCLIAVGIYALVRRRFSIAMRITVLASVLALLPALTLVLPVTFPSSLETERPLATVRLPADGPLTVVWGGDTRDVNQHVGVPDQRWAYDLLAAPFFVNSKKLEDYGCYGIPVVAPAAGLVSIAHDGESDGTPTVVPTSGEARGNFVAIKMDSGTYLLIGHLKSGSVAVKTGQQVQEGQVIGQCGNSGHSSEPHIHIHHQRQNPAEFPINFAEGLPLYFRDHNGPAMPRGGVKIEGEKVTALGDVVQHIGQ